MTSTRQKLIFSLAFLVASVSYSGEGDEAGPADAPVTLPAVVDAQAAEGLFDRASGFVKGHQTELAIAGAVLIIGAVVAKRIQARRTTSVSKSYLHNQLFR